MGPSVGKMRVCGLIMAITVALFDQWTKMLVISTALSNAIPVTIFSWFNLVLVGNTGVSFGLFAHPPAWRGLTRHPQATLAWFMDTQHLLTLGTSVIVLILLGWLLRARETSVILALGFIIGGAIGNIVDRIERGAVTDFLDFHWQEQHWPAFNAADSFIFIGVVILILGSIVSSRSH